METKHLLVNFWQSAKDRQAKYWLVRSLGANPSHARRMRDWHLSKIERLFNLDRSNKFKPELERANQHITHITQHTQVNTLSSMPPHLEKEPGVELSPSLVSVASGL